LNKGSFKKVSGLISSHIQRLFFTGKSNNLSKTVLITFVFIHIMTAVWIMLLSFDEEDRSWYSRIAATERQAYPESGVRLYLLGVYYTVATIATVGYGDLVSNNLCTPHSCR
jgi:hypothetical protein